MRAVLIFSKIDLVEATGVGLSTIYEHQRTGKIPQPAITYNGKSAYTKKQFLAICNRLKGNTVDEKNKDLITFGGAAARLGLPRSTLTGYTERGIVKRPQHRKGKRYFYTEADLVTMKEQLANIPMREYKNLSIVESMIAKGFYSKVQAAKKLGMPKGTFEYKVKCKELPAPTTPYLSRTYYTEADLEKMRESLKVYYRRTGRE